MEVDMESLQQLRGGNGTARHTKTRQQTAMDVCWKVAAAIFVMLMVYALNIAAIETTQVLTSNAQASDGEAAVQQSGNAGTSSEGTSTGATTANTAATTGETDSQVSVIEQPAIQFVLCGELTKNTTLFNVYDYIITCAVNVHPGVTLTIQPGTYLRANDTWDSTVPALNIQQGAKINASGTQDHPITFTTAKTFVNEGETGLWGGITIYGKATVTDNASSYSGRAYGGNDDDDNSGILRFVRIWYAGNDDDPTLTPLAALCLAGVGRGTHLDHVEAAYSKADGIMLLGGMANMKHVATYFSDENAMKIDNGYQGDIQFLFAMVATLGKAGLDISSAGDLQPRTHPSIRSATLLGNWPHNLNAMIKVHNGAGATLQNMLCQNAEVAVQMDKCAQDDQRLQGLQQIAFSYPDYFFFGENNVIYTASDDYQTFQQTPDCAGGLAKAIQINPQLSGIPEQLDPLPNGALSPMPLVTSPVMDPSQQQVEGSGFFETVSYGGAFDGAADDMWIRDWTWLDFHRKLLPKPQDNTEYLCGAQKEDKTLFRNTSYVLTCQWFIRTGAVLTLEPGVTIKSSEDQSGRSPAIVIQKGAKILADCTVTQPCTFSSTVAEANLPADGKWGGLVICGDAPSQGNSSGVINGLKGSEYGGMNTKDSSGILRNVRVWYGGHQLEPGAYVAGLTFAGVGSGTVIENVEVAYSEYHGIDFLGGTPDTRYVSVLYARKSGIRFSYGYNGRMQFAFIMTPSYGEHGMLLESNVDDTSFFTQPRTHPQVRSVTIIGQPDNSDSLLKVTGASGGSLKTFALQGTNIFEHTNCANEEVVQGLPSISRPHFLYISPNNIYINLTSDYTMVSSDDTCEVETMNRSRRLAANDSESGENTWIMNTWEKLLAEYKVVPQYDNRRQREIAEANYEPGFFKDMPAWSGSLNGSDIDPRITLEARQAMVRWIQTLEGTSDGDPDDGTFFEPTPYIGAFSDGYGSENQWLEGWTYVSEYGKIAENEYNAAFRPGRFAALLLSFAVLVFFN